MPCTFLEVQRDKSEIRCSDEQIGLAHIQNGSCTDGEAKDSINATKRVCLYIARILL